MFQLLSRRSCLFIYTKVCACHICSPSRSVSLCSPAAGSLADIVPGEVLHGKALQGALKTPAFPSPFTLCCPLQGLMARPPKWGSGRVKDSSIPPGSHLCCGPSMLYGSCPLHYHFCSVLVPALCPQRSSSTRSVLQPPCVLVGCCHLPNSSQLARDTPPKSKRAFKRTKRQLGVQVLWVYLGAMGHPRHKRKRRV